MVTESLEPRLMLTCGTHSVSIATIPAIDEGNGQQIEINVTGTCGATLDVQFYDGAGQEMMDSYSDWGGEGLHTYEFWPEDDDPTGTPGDTYSVVATLTDMAGAPLASDTQTFQVSNLPPVINSFAAEFDANMGYVALSGDVTDPGINDTFDITIDWGDGTTETQTDLLWADFSLFVHPYADSGTYTIEATVQDDDTGVANATTTVTVPPNAPPTLNSVTPWESEVLEGDLLTIEIDGFDEGEGELWAVIDTPWGATLEESLGYWGGYFTSTVEFVVIDDHPASGQPQDTGECADTVRRSHWPLPVSRHYECR